MRMNLFRIKMAVNAFFGGKIRLLCSTSYLHIKKRTDEKLEPAKLDGVKLRPTL